MTFRVRVIVTITVAVTTAVLFACLSSFLATRNAVQRSSDESLYNAARSNPVNGEGTSSAGVLFQIVLSNGSSYPTAVLPIDHTLMRAAEGHSGEILRTVEVADSSYRELIVPLAAGTILHCDIGPCKLTTNAAQIFSVNITGQQHQLRVLAWRLILLALAGVLFAAILGILAARTALGPLETVTNEIEEVAETSNIAHRLKEGRNDELGRLRRVFNHLLESVNDSQRMQRQLVVDASHELRTPLTSLRTNAQVLKRADRLAPDELTQITDDMIAQVDELASLITDLTELARGLELNSETEVLRLDELVDDCVATARTYARTRNVTIKLDADSCAVDGHRDRVVRAVNNLLSNSIKFAKIDGHVEVTVRAGVVEVEDDGPGVATEDEPFVFDRFWRSPRARSQPGSGLGLAIVSQVAQDMGGLVGVTRSSSLGGAKFTLKLPESDSEAPD